MEVPRVVEKDTEEKVNKLSVEFLNSESNVAKSWPVPMPIPVKTLHIKGARRNRRRPCRYKYAYMKNWLIPLDGPMSMEHLHFILDCFVVSFGPEPPQLGRYHPQSDPEEFTNKQDDLWSLSSEDDHHLPTTWMGLQSTSTDKIPTVSWSDMEDDISGHSVLNRAVARVPDTRVCCSGFDRTSPDDAIVRELSEMRLVLERLLENHELVDWNHQNGLRDILSLLSDGNISPREPSPHYPVGDWEFDECGICMEVQWLYRRACCHFPACSTCLRKYYSAKVDDSRVKIECCNTECSHYVHRDEILARLDVGDKERFHRLLVLVNQDATIKTCPRCSHVTKQDGKSKKNGDPKSSSVICPSCELEWCFNCHAPWHAELTCKQFRKGDRLLRSWARERNHGQLNAQRCPKCKIYIQRTTGCDHMHCTRCKTDFCYKCGDRFRYLKFFGDHYSKLSIFGCKYRFKADRPVQRKVIRGAIFGGKLVAAPILGALALCAGALAVGVSVFALPVYGGVRLYKHCEERHLAKAVRRQGKGLNSKYVRRDCFLSPILPSNQHTEN